MKRSIGVLVIAVLSLLGSALTLLMGVLMLAVMAFAPTPSQQEFAAPPVFFKLILAMGALVYFVPAIWGIVTSIGLFNFRNWARISIIVFSVLLILMGGFSALMSLLIPDFPSKGMDQGVVAGVRIAMTVFWLGLLGIGIWWLVFFNREGVKKQFVPYASPLPPPAPQIFAASGLQSAGFQSAVPMSVHRAPERPISLTVIAWFLLVGALFSPLNMVLHFPGFLFTRLLTGWFATLYYLVFASVSLYVGIGLLRFVRSARVVGVAYFAFALVNAAVFYLAPGGRARIRALLDAQQSLMPWMQFYQNRPEFQFDPMPFVYIGGMMGLTLIAVPLYFLITRKEAFEAAARAR